ncbi:MAG TPA: type II toxin-antitoxin system prevent-host-death family antitoxin [Thermoanaerobaculia bacterium]|nr:type II toxin-antitoxin system prevent-host-death family antitoxin [Thermoanaerobaculia bacterium]
MAIPARREESQRSIPNPTVGVRELRQNLSRYLRRVEAGETLEVTEHGRPVAVLAPLPPPNEDILDRLIREGRARPAKGDLLDVKPLPRITEGPTLSEILDELREDVI